MYALVNEFASVLFVGWDRKANGAELWWSRGTEWSGWLAGHLRSSLRELQSCPEPSTCGGKCVETDVILWYPGRGGTVRYLWYKIYSDFLFYYFIFIII